MTFAFVADASVAMGWVHPAQATAATGDMLNAMQEGAVLEVPALWTLEVSNALLLLTRRRKLAEQDRALTLRWLRALPLRVDHEASALAFDRISALAERTGLTIYDATYLELADRKRLRLATSDAGLAAAARQLGVPTWR